MKLPDVSGVFDYAGPTRDSRYRPRRVAFHQVKSVGVLIASFRSSIPSPPVPLFTLRHAPHGTQRKTRGRVVRYSFLVGLLHSLLHAGLSRRTELAILRPLTPATPTQFPVCRLAAVRSLNYRDAVCLFLQADGVKFFHRSSIIAEVIDVRAHG